MDSYRYGLRGRGRSLIVYGDAVGQWVAQQTDGTYCREHAQALGLERDGQIVAGIIYEGWTGKSIVAHLAIRGKITREFMWVISDYAFRQHGCHKVVAPIYADNAPMIRLALNMGFTEEARIRDAQPAGDLVFYTLTKDRCRFLGERYGKT